MKKRIFHNLAFLGASAVAITVLLGKIQGQQRMIRRQMEELADDRGTIKAITGNMREGLIMVSPRGTILSVNSSAIALLGAAPGDWAGRDIGELSQLPELSAALSSALEGRAASLTAWCGQLFCRLFANPVYQDMMGRAGTFLGQLSSALAFEDPELAAIPEEPLDAFYADLPALEKYRRYLTRARSQRAHILSPAEEKLLAGAGEVGSFPGEIFNSFIDADLKFPPVADSQGREHPLTNGSYISLLESGDRTLRKNAFHALYAAYGGSRNALAAMLRGSVTKDLFYSRSRRYESTLASAMALSEVPEAVYHSLIGTVHRNMDKMYRYMALRKRALGLETLHMYDLFVPIVPASQRTIPFSQAREEVLEAVGVLGEDYRRIAASGFEARWMDIYENEGKRSGAYSCGCAVHPYILLNHKDDLHSEFTLAHELGHAMHSYLSNRSQPPVYAGYVLFVAEVASTCNEALLMRRLLEKTEDRQQRAVLINYFLEQFRTTLYRQTMFAEFELDIHRMVQAGEILTAQRLCETYYRLNQLYYGDHVEVDRDIEMEWARVPHFSRRFYVYQYATGFSAAMALSRRILEGGEEAAADYLRFLSGGCSADPVSLLKTAGVDMSTPRPVNDALELFGRLIDELEELLG